MERTDTRSQTLGAHTARCTEGARESEQGGGWQAHERGDHMVLHSLLEDKAGRLAERVQTGDNLAGKYFNKKLFSCRLNASKGQAR